MALALPVNAREWYPPLAIWIIQVLSRLGIGLGFQPPTLSPLPSS